MREVQRAIFIILAAAVLSGLTAIGASAQANDVYLTPDGGGNGVCTSNVHTPSWFSNSGNWGSGGSQIGPGTTVHLCGTFNASAGADAYLQFQGSGTNGNPITLLWESGAVVQAPYFSSVHGGIDLGGQSWIVLDGGSNGIIQNTSNGTGRSYQNGSILVKTSGSNNVIKNLSMLNVYVHQNGDHNGGGTYGLYSYSGSNLTVGPNNSFTQCDVCFFFAWNGGEHDLVITGNSFANGNQDIEMGPANTGVRNINNIRVDHNTATGWSSWDDSNNNYHHNFFHPFTNTSGSSMTGSLQIYDNTLSGDMGNHATSMIFIENNNGGSGGTMGSWYIFNNTFDKTNSTAPGSSGIVALMSTNGFFLNNVIRDAGGSGNYAYTSLHLYGSGWTMKNNIFQGGAYMVYNEGGNLTADRNVYYNPASNTPWINHSAFQGSLSNWQSACGCDGGAVTTDPLLNSDLSIRAGSSASSLGTNLSSMGISALNLDKTGAARPSSSWSSGAIQLGSVSAQQPNPPTGLAATVN